MLDIKFIRENVELIRKTCVQKHINPELVDLLIEHDKKRREKIQNLEALRNKRNEWAKKIAQLKDPKHREELIGEMASLKKNEKKLNEAFLELENLYHKTMLLMPMPVRSDTPEGKDETGNVEVYTKGEIPKFDFKPKDHMTLMQMLGMVDIERAVKIGGARSYFLKGDAALLEQAILQYTFKKLVEKGFTPITVPYMVGPECLEGTGYFPGGEEDAYHMERDDKWLIGTGEIPLTSYHKDEILEENELPKTYVTMSACFRREAGSYGKDTQGLYRMHQFNKVEQVVILPADVKLSDEWHEKILKNAQEVLDDMEVPYRLLQLCTGDLGLGKYTSHDLECWMPSRGGYGETHSATSFKDFQARRLNLRYKDKSGKTHFCYTLNNTAIATPRFLISLIECNQNADGSIDIPKALQPYMGGRKKICR